MPAEPEVAMVQQKRARVTRERIMAGAADVIRRVGYERATLGEITDAAGVTKGALYFHFATKEDIARALVDEQHRIVRESAALILETPRPALEQMMMLCSDLALRLVDDPIVRAGIRLTTDSSTFETPLAEPYRDWISTFGELAERAARDGEIVADIPPEMLAGFIIPAFTGVQLVSETFTGRTDLPERIHDMWRILLEAITPAARRADALRTAARVFAR
jgi:AcrR family transcriptional regulator